MDMVVTSRHLCHVPAAAAVQAVVIRTRVTDIADDISRCLSFERPVHCAMFFLLFY